MKKTNRLLHCFNFGGKNGRPFCSSCVDVFFGGIPEKLVVSQEDPFLLGGSIFRGEALFLGRVCVSFQGGPSPETEPNSGTNLGIFRVQGAGAGRGDAYPTFHSQRSIPRPQPTHVVHQPVLKLEKRHKVNSNNWFEAPNPPKKEGMENHLSCGTPQKNLQSRPSKASSFLSSYYMRGAG